MFFAEPPTNQIVTNLNMMNLLQSCLQQLKPKVSTSRGLLPKDLRLRAEEAVINLARFIEYKFQQFK